MTTPRPPLEERVSILETRLDTILPTLATKEDVARLEGKMDAMNERLEGKMEAMEERLEGKMNAMEQRLEGKIGGVDRRIDTMEYRLLIRFTGVLVAVATVAVAAAKFL